MLGLEKQIIAAIKCQNYQTLVAKKKTNNKIKLISRNKVKPFFYIFILLTELLSSGDYLTYNDI